jgi:methionyl-tRNA formyltransferase
MYTPGMSPPLSIVFCGTSAYAVRCLEALAQDSAYTVTLVVSQPDRPAGRKRLLTPPPVKEAAVRLGLPVAQPEKLNKALEEIQAGTLRPDYLVVVAYGQILSQAVLDWPSRMAVNVHGSLLPRWRGASPIHQAILAGDAETGVTVQKMAKELDAGAILTQESTSIGPRETFESLYERLSSIGAGLLVRTLKDPPTPREQDNSLATFCRTFTREDGLVDPKTHTADEIDRRVRALNPWPGVTAEMDGEPLKILGTSLEPVAESVPLPCAGSTTLHLVTVQPAGKKPMSGAAWMRGRKQA